MEFFGGMRRGPKNNQVDFDGDPSYDPDAGIF